MIKITAKDAINALTHIVSDKGPDFRYQILPCKYEVDGAPSCGVAQALSHLGVPLPVIKGMDTMNSENNGGIAIRAAGPYLEKHGVAIDYYAAFVLQRFQSYQDAGAKDDTMTWGVALNRAQLAFNTLQPTHQEA